ncbi:ABC transporter permease [Streptoalloteichus hindustanus]|uniref:ABC-2 type transport system permease protein n=1 Tax=Streptoalloteichus hindustanus TaxID=2017 RepID=A0A1M5GIH8_STRHI|nr:ABC transporter permease [Streptoalloteichus hindustanus]SHG03555.1 ABC-2 type transport system permease protein [Streptoalloteichus hindustanus]
MTSSARRGGTASSFRSLSTAMLKGFVRDRAGLFFVFLFPLMFLVVFGLIFGKEGGTKPKIGVVGDGPVVVALEQSGAVELERLGATDDAVRKVRDGDLPAAVLAHGDTVELRYAASDQTQAGLVRGIVGGVVDKVNIAASGQPPKVRLDSQQVEDSSLKAIQFLTPGLLSWAVSTSAIFGSAVTLVSWRRKQVLRRIRLAPVPVSTVLSSRLLVSMGIAVGQTALFIGVASTPVFGLSLSGQWWLALPLVMLGTLAFFAIGMFAGSFAKTEETATAAANLVVLPMAFLSGTFFPIQNAPGWLQAVSQALPLRHLTDGMLDVMVRGKGIEALAVPAAVLVGFAVVLGAVASRLFRWDDA